MSQENKPQEFRERARKNRLEISVSDADHVELLLADVAAAYSTIREIDTAGFEPAAIFVPTPSKRESD
jgi:hypothetical protein